MAETQTTEEIAALEARLRDLEAEHRGIPALLKDALLSGRDAESQTLVARKADLPREMYRVNARLMHLRARRTEEEIEEADREAERLEAEYPARRARHEAEMADWEAYEVRYNAALGMPGMLRRGFTRGTDHLCSKWTERFALAPPSEIRSLVE